MNASVAHLTPTTLMWPTLQALRALGGSAHISEIAEQVIQAEGFTDEQVAVPHEENGRQSEIEYLLGWARTQLKGIGVVENSSRGVWSLTDLGRTINEEQMNRDTNAWLRRLAERRKAARRPAESEVTGMDEAATGGDEESDWKEVLLDRLLEMPPDAFERLAQRLLREAGFQNVEVMGRSGDGGLDGVGVYRLELMSFPIYFQCKRWRNQVTSSVVRDFRGAMEGRGDRGLVITTGSFTRDARREATRDGAKRIDLVDGDNLCDLLKEYKLGVKVEMVEKPSVEPSFFDQF